VTHFFLAYEYWQKESEIAKKISKLIKQNSVTPLLHDHEDHYFIYRFTEILEAALIERKMDTEYVLPSEKLRENKVYFENANIKIYNNDKKYIVINLKKAGVIHSWDKVKSKLNVDNGVMLKLKNKKTYSTDSNEVSNRYNISTNKLTISGQLKVIPRKYFNPITFIGFRVFMLIVGRTPKVASYVKGIIKSLLITPSKLSDLYFERSLEIDNDTLIISVTNKITCQNKISGELFANGFFYSRYVPQSRYFNKSDLQNSVKTRKKITEQKIIIDEYKV
jgi:hypothetical protein